MNKFSDSLGPTSVRTNNLRQLIRKCTTLTLAVQTSPTARLHLHHHGGALRRQVLKVSEVSAVPTRRRLVASGTEAYFRSRGRDHPAIAIPLDPNNPHARPRSPIHGLSHARAYPRGADQPNSTESEADPSNVRIFWVDILTFDGFFGAKFDILKPRWLPTPTPPRAPRRPRPNRWLPALLVREPWTPFCLSSGDSRGVDFLAALRDEREDLSGKVTLQSSNWRRVWNALRRVGERRSPWSSDRVRKRPIAMMYNAPLANA
jgi:hypothetical protein